MSKVVVDGEIKREYLGDGVYASFDGYHVWLRVERDNGVDEIALDSQVFEQLVRYWKKLEGTA